jgi:HK97 family phage major capsid protein/HK97 family phage prohead protease
MGERKMERAWARFELKQVNEEQGIIEGIASTPTTDRMDDIVEPLGAQFDLPLPFLYQHNSRMPIGWVTGAKPTKDGIPVTVRIAKEVPVSFIQEAWTLIKAKLVQGLSIGFSSLEQADIKGTFGRRFIKWEWLELSAVTIPANAEATITNIKSYDSEFLRAASGAPAETKSGVRLTSSPGATGHQLKGAGKVKTIKEQLEAAEAKRAANVARMEELMKASGEEGRGLDESEGQEYDDLNNEIKNIDKHLARLRDLEKTVGEKATPVSTGVVSTQPDTSAARQGNTPLPAVSWAKERKLAPGIRFARYAMCVGAAKGNMMQAELLARDKFKDTPEVADILKLATRGNLGDALLQYKTAVAAGTSTDATWAGPLVNLQEMASEFVEYLRPLTLLGRIPGIRNVPFNIKFARQNTGSNGTFVGEGAPKPLAALSFELLSLTYAKAATIIVLTEELMRFSNPSAEMLVRDDLANGIAQYLDKRFIDPVYAGVANVSPASITNGVTPIPSQGTSIANITDTCAVALDALIGGNFDPRNYVWIMNPSIANDLSLKRTTQDVFAFPGINALGGTFLGYPVVTSNNVVLSGSPTESFVVLCDPTQIMLADDGGVTIDMSNQASVEMSDAPSGGATSLVSLWQNNLVGLRAERFINWRTRHSGAVQVITMNVKW